MLVCGYEFTADLRSLALRLRVATHSSKIQVVGSVGVLNTGMFIDSLVTTVFYIQSEESKPNFDSKLS